MDYLSHNISINLRRIRQSKSMSLERAAEQTGVSKSMLAQIEKGTANPSLGVLGKITSGLRIEFQRLIETPKEDFCLVKPEALVPTKEIEGQYRVWTCFPYEDTRLVEIYRIDVEPGGVYMSGASGGRRRSNSRPTSRISTATRAERARAASASSSTTNKHRFYQQPVDKTCEKVKGSIQETGGAFLRDFYFACAVMMRMRPLPRS